MLKAIKRTKEMFICTQGTLMQPPYSGFPGLK